MFNTHIDLTRFLFLSKVKTRNYLEVGVSLLVRVGGWMGGWENNENNAILNSVEVGVELGNTIDHRADAKPSLGFCYTGWVSPAGQSKFVQPSSVHSVKFGFTNIIITTSTIIGIELIFIIYTTTSWNFRQRLMLYKHIYITMPK